MEVHVLFMIFVSCASIGLARRVKAGTDRTESHNVGSTIANRYILVHELEDRRYGHGGPLLPKHEYAEHTKLGEGSYATAYKATDINENKDVVLKILNKNMADDHAAQQQTFDECNVMQALQREDLIQIFPEGAKNLMRCSRNNIKVGRKGLGNNQFIVLEYGGIQLDKVPQLGLDVENRGKHIVEIVNQTLRGLVYLAGLGVAHRDLKPDNILVQYDVSGNVKIKIIDFGSMAYGNDVHCAGSECKLLGHSGNKIIDCTDGANDTVVCDDPWHSTSSLPSDSCSFTWEEDVFAPPEVRHKNQRVCLTPDYPVDAFDIWSLGMTVVQLVNVKFDGDCGVGDGCQADAPNKCKESFWGWTQESTYLDSSSGGLLSEFCASALQRDYSARGRLGKSNDQLRLVDLIKIFDAKFQSPNFPKLQLPLIRVSSDLERLALKHVTSRHTSRSPRTSRTEDEENEAAT